MALELLFLMFQELCLEDIHIYFLWAQASPFWAADRIVDWLLWRFEEKHPLD